MRFHTKTNWYGRYFKDRPISIVALNVFRDSESDAGGVGSKIAISV